MIQRRAQAFNDAISERLKTDEDEDETAQAKPAKRRRSAPKPFRAVTEKHRHYVPHHLTMQLPPVQEGGPELEVKVLFKGIATKTIWLELRSDVLERLKLGLLSSSVKGPKAAAQKPQD